MEFWSTTWLGSVHAHRHELAEEDDEGEEGEEEAEEEEGVAPLLKSGDPHLAGGEKHNCGQGQPFDVLVCPSMVEHQSSILCIHDAFSDARINQLELTLFAALRVAVWAQSFVAPAQWVGDSLVLVAQLKSHPTGPTRSNKQLTRPIR